MNHNAIKRIFEHVHLTKAIRLPRLHLLRSMKFTMDRKSLQTIYFSFIRPLLEYADVVWDNCTQQQIKELEKIQIEAGRIVSGTTKLVAIDKLYRELGWLKLSERRKLHKLFLFYKMQNGLAPDYLVDLVPPRVGNETPYSLRNADNYQQVHANSRLTSFKYKFERNSPKIPKYYFFGDRGYEISYLQNVTPIDSHRQ